MQRLQRSNFVWTFGRCRRVLAVAAVVMLAHALVLQMATRPMTASGPRPATIELRQLPVSTPMPQATATAALQAAPVAPTPQTIAKRQPKPPRAEPAPIAATLVPADAPIAPAPATPTPTRVPPSTELVFTLQRGAQTGEARMSWRSDGERYALSLHATLPSGREIEQHSQGGFDAAGLAPLRLADRRHGRDVRAANFQREHGKVTFSGPRWELPLEVGTQDRLSWLVQLVARVGAVSDDLRDGTELAMWVVGARGAASHWRFEVRGQQRVELDGQPADAWWLVREPAHPYDLRVEVWLSPQQGHWPLKLRQTQIPGGEALEWLLRRQAPLQPGT